MVNIIKTAIITIIISFISGLLLEYYKNLAPRILCNIKNAMPIKINNEKISACIIDITNVSNKTIHDLTLYIQNPHTNLRVADAKITKGLKFDSSINNNILDVYIPFLSKDDKFSVTIYPENQHEICTKPVIIIRSPENFKQIDSLEETGFLCKLLNIPKNVYQVILNILKKPEASIPNKKDDFTMVMPKTSDNRKMSNEGTKKTLHKNKNLSNTKKAIIATISIILLIFVGALGKFYFKGIPTNTSKPDTKNTVPKHSDDDTNSSEATKSPNSKASNKRTNGNTSSKTSPENTNENTNSKTPVEETNKNIDSKTSTGEMNKTTDSKTPTGKTTENTNSKTSTGETNKDASSKASNGGTNENSGSKSAAEKTTENVGSKSTTEGANANK